MMLPDFTLSDQYRVPSPRLGAFCSGICRAEKGPKEKRKWIRGCVTPDYAEAVSCVTSSAPHCIGLQKV